MINHKYRWALLLAASCYFYMVFKPIYILILGFTIVVDYYAGIAIENSDGKRRKLFLIASLVANIGVLAIFKYYNFLNDILGKLLHFKGIENPVPMLTILLPIGLSFHTFQAMSYTIEVYRGNQKAERKFGIYALYVMFYPQLVAGPIERPQNLLHQFYEKHEFDYGRVADGLKLMLWGFFKKVVIADRLAVLVNQVYDHPSNYEGLPLIIATVFFSFQIFCDFSAYSDIAIGAAKVMGFNLMKNFNRPYSASSISEFWSRWHISLSTWFRDYLYIPLGGNRVSNNRWYFNLAIVFLISGLWHGARFTFIIWGAMHGFFMISELLLRRLLKQAPVWLFKLRNGFIAKKLKVVIVFFLVSFAWIFFRATSIHGAGYISTHLFTGIVSQVKELFNGVLDSGSNYLYPGANKMEFIIAILSILFLETIHFFQRKHDLIKYINTKPRWLRWGVYYIAIIAILVLGVFENSPQFIYFQF